ncbi:Short-chain dehydrogenase TIC 32, chloroplastic [Apostasia shenzhenica]|uniref:Short-chain dehydrogenase TIC 32, chloroplastic n=1 Tax=Apostasia shenzhenica TaxID=1088818 RepID=A0A2I0B2L4_9ASPA|nr:Short-chain dehydrogenase TIC 32, chloroplastic [Apostasia shenzhenica]
MKIMKWVIYFFYNIYDCLSEKWEFVCGAFRYLYGVKGQSGFGSSSTADQVVESFSSSFSTSFRLTAIITGATSGIGEETARVLAKRGVRVVMPARDMKKAGEVKERILKESPEALLILMELDLSSFSSIQSFCSKFLQLSLPLNILINNAGKFCRRLEHTTESFEMTFGTNYLGHYLLTKFLLKKLIETASETEIEGRIINVTSVIHRWATIEGFVFDDLLNPKNYNGTRAYAQSKLANLMHAKELTAQLRSPHLQERRANVTVNSVHPGIVKTGIIRDHRGLITGIFLGSDIFCCSEVP